ncbi:MAG: GNAT family N-acetyltransferase [Oscillospiraceae bacterium]|nr:GNAT family N-acetyltransferase [Oscillospiraceae bacterium]
MIRDVEKSELSRCAELIRRSFMTVAEDFGFTAENAPGFTAFAATEERLLYQLEQERRVMRAYCTGGGQLIGYYSLLPQDNDECELSNLCVLPEYRRSGVASLLLEDARLRAGELGRVKMNIGIVEENRPLRRWYESRGFVHTGTEKFERFPFTCGYLETAL